MKQTIALLTMTLLYYCGIAHAQSPDVTTPPCAIALRALEAYRVIKPGLARKDVEKTFKYDGGIQFPDEARFVYKDWAYIKLDITFEPAANRGSELASPDDIVKTVSRLYIDYPIKD